jgi:hypothetical protein
VTTLRRCVSIVLLLAALPGWAATVSTSMRVTELEAQQSTRLVIVVSGEQRVNPPRFPEVDGLQITYAERSTRIEQSPQGYTRTIAFAYRVSPQRPGTFTIPSVEILLPDRSTLRTQPVVLTATEAGSSDLPTQPLSAKAAFDRELAWEGEVVLYETEVTARTRIGTVNWRLPPFKGLTRPAHGDVQDETTVIGDPRGDITIVERTYPFIASGTGNRTQPPAVATVDVLTGGRSLWGSRRRKTKVAATDEARLQVRPLPSPPDGFSGLVGDFQIQSKVGKTTAEVGETVPWGVLINGTGVVDGFQLDDLEVPGARVYLGDTEEGGRLVDAGYQSSKVFRFSLVPTEPGELVLPPLEVVVFSPNEGRYVTLKADVGRLTVTGEAMDDEMKSFASLDDVEVPEPVVPVDVYTWGLADTPPLPPVLPFLLFGVSFPLGLVLVGDVGGAVRSGLAARRARRTVAVRGAARLASLPDGGPERLAVLDLALREALADHVRVDVGALRRPEALAALHDDLRDRVARAFASLDRVRFAGGSADEDLLVAVRDAIERLS